MTGAAVVWWGSCHVGGGGPEGSELDEARRITPHRMQPAGYTSGGSGEAHTSPELEGLGSRLHTRAGALAFWPSVLNPYYRTPTGSQSLARSSAAGFARLPVLSALGVVVALVAGAVLVGHHYPGALAVVAGVLLAALVAFAAGGGVGAFAVAVFLAALPGDDADRVLDAAAELAGVDRADDELEDLERERDAELAGLHLVRRYRDKLEHEVEAAAPSARFELSRALALLDATIPSARRES